MWLFPIRYFGFGAKNNPRLTLKIDTASGKTTALQLKSESQLTLKTEAASSRITALRLKNEPYFPLTNQTVSQKTTALRLKNKPYKQNYFVAQENFYSFFQQPNAANNAPKDNFTGSQVLR